MKVFVLGGTGFIGYHSSVELLNRGHNITTLSLPDFKPGNWYPEEIDIIYDNIFEKTEKELIGLFSGFDALVYALGPDDRTTPKAPAYDFFHEYLVEKCGLVVSAARIAGVRKCIVLNSYFAYFDRTFPEYKLAEHHPYIKCRIEQAERVISEGNGLMDVVVLELPYIFGTMPGREPLWKDVLSKMGFDRKMIFYPKGGSNMISVEHVAEAVAGALENGRHGNRYTIGDENLTWIEMLDIMIKALGSDKKVITVPCFLAALYGIAQKRKDKREGKEAGLDYVRLFRDFLCREFFFDPSESAKELGYGRGGIEKAISRTMKASL